MSYFCRTQSKYLASERERERERERETENGFLGSKPRKIIGIISLMKKKNPFSRRRRRRWIKMKKNK